jgi:hypothetical protein
MKGKMKVIIEDANGQQHEVEVEANIIKGKLPQAINSG